MLCFWPMLVVNPFDQSLAIKAILEYLGMFCFLPMLIVNLFDQPLMLRPRQLDFWFDPRNNGVNKEADAHPAILLGKHDAVSTWGQGLNMQNDRITLFFFFFFFFFVF